MDKVFAIRFGWLIKRLDEVAVSEYDRCAGIVSSIFKLYEPYYKKNSDLINEFVKRSNLTGSAVDVTCKVDLKTLVVCPQYPSKDKLYANQFVHSRLKAYQREGYSYDVFSVQDGIEDSERDYDGVHILQGSKEFLADAIDRRGVKLVLAHLLDYRMWEVLKPRLGKLRVIAWVHGADVQPWWRREFNYQTPRELERAKKKSVDRQKVFEDAFEVAQKNPDKLHFVFVSKYFANEVAEDYRVKLPKKVISVIHNGIDTKTFSYQRKDTEQRKYVRSVRPWANRTYGNDIAVRSVVMLSEQSPHEFADMKFLFVGQGALWDELTAPLSVFTNVTLRKEFLTHEQIAALHKQYGVFLVPTRLDSQGVSRDEAMSSGLVAITNEVAAIPEFCTNDEDSLLVPGEDAQGMADAMLRIYRDHDLFLRISANAAARVRRQSAEDIITESEIALIKSIGQ